MQSSLKSKLACLCLGMLSCASLLTLSAPSLAAPPLAERERNCAIQTRGLRERRNDHLNACVNLGWYLHLQGQDRAAIAVLAEVARLDPSSEKAFNALGVIYLFTGAYQRAVEANQMAIRLAADNEIAYYNLSLAQWQLGQYPAAVSSAREAVRLEPANPHPQVALAIARWRTGDRAGAATAYKQAIRLDRRYTRPAHLEKLRASDFSPGQVQVARTILDAVR